MIDNTDFFNASEIEELKKAFFAQAHEILENLQDALLRLEKAPEDGDTLKAAKRYIHTLKGDANSVGLAAVGILCHSFEDLLVRSFDGAGFIDSEAVAILFSAVDVMQRIVSESERGTNGTDSRNIMAQINAFLVRTTRGNVQETKPALIPVLHLTEYQLLQTEEAFRNGLVVYDIEVDFHPLCSERGIAAFMLLRKLSEAGQIIVSDPDPEGETIDAAETVSFVIATAMDPGEISRHAQITGITGEIRVAAREQQAHLQTSSMQGTVGTQTGKDMLRIETTKVDRVMNLVGELIIGRSMIEQITLDAENALSAADIAKRLSSASAYMNRTVSDLQMIAMKMRMVPVNHVFRRFPKIVRDLSMEKKKSVRLVIRGKETELDKSIVDGLGEPLAHIIRNAIDHGIEDAQSRRDLGKTDEAVITLSAYHQAAHIVIEVSDDGRGIDAAKLRTRAVAQGFVTLADAEKLSDQETLGLIFCAGLSTADTVSETSGRGVGMDAVKAAIEAMKGMIEVESTPGAGTTFRMQLPLTLAVIKALLVEVSDRNYAIPISMISEVVRVTDKDLSTVDGREIVMLRKHIISVIRLDDLFGYHSTNESKKTLVILSVRGNSVGLLVDRLTCQQELVIKAIDRDYTQSNLVSGASILGNGRVILILDVAAVFRKMVDDEKKKMVGA